MRRRTFLLSTAGAGATLFADIGGKAVDKLIPYVNPPERIRPGTWGFYATTCRECPAGCGIEVWHRDGRVTKAEGNPEHPINRGALCARGQAALQGLYDPDRLRGVMHRAEGGEVGTATWADAAAASDEALGEPVCPVYANVHDGEGLNNQVYNRCVGTRYCSNNCPYKVRRFNWLNVNWREPLTLQLNPEVTVRERGVMEKCTFCVQRIRQAEYRAKREGRPVRDGEIVPACVQTCPMGVFVFGDLLDPWSRVTEMTRNNPRRYHVLEDLNTKPAVTFLRRIKRAELA
jgi:Fe-S-cluster-containing dehydrogenase component